MLEQIQKAALARQKIENAKKFTLWQGNANPGFGSVPKKIVKTPLWQGNKNPSFGAVPTAPVKKAIAISSPAGRAGRLSIGSPAARKGLRASQAPNDWFANAIKDTGNFASKNADTIFKVGSVINPTTRLLVEGLALAKVVGAYKGDPLKETGNFTKRAVANVLDTAANAPEGAWLVGSAMSELAQGNPKPIKELGQSALDNEPLLLLAQGRTDEAAKKAWENPGNLAISLIGFGRGSEVLLAKAAKTGIAGPTIKAIVKEPRVSASDPNTGMRKPRPVSKGFITAAIQKSDDTRNMATADALRAEARTKGLAEDKKQDAIRRAAAIDPRRLSPKDAQKMVDEQRDMQASLDRDNHGKYIKITNEIEKRTTPFTSLIVQGIVKPTTQSISKYIDKIEKGQKTPAGNLTPEARALVSKNIRDLRGALPKFNPVKEIETARKYKESMDAAQKEAIANGVLTRGEVNAGNLQPYAISQMGAKWTEGTGPVVNRKKTVLRQAEAKGKKSVGVASPESISKLDLARATKDASLKQINSLKTKAAKADERAKKTAQGQVANKEADLLFKAIYARDAAAEALGAARKLKDKAAITQANKDLNVADKALESAKGKATRSRAPKSIREVTAIKNELAKARAALAEDTKTTNQLRADIAKEKKGNVSAKAQAGIDKAQAELLQARINRQNGMLEGPHLAGPNGRYLSNREILAHQEKSNQAGTAYATQRVAGDSPAPASGGVPEVLRAQRTGVHTEYGAIDTSKSGLAENIAKIRLKTQLVEGFRQNVAEFGVKKPSGKTMTVETWDDAKTLADAFREDGYDYVPVRINPRGGRGSQLDKTISESISNNTSEGLIQAYKDVFKGSDQSAGEWALMPRAVVNHINAHINAIDHVSTPAKVMVKINRIFRNNVLTVSTKWLSSNVIEAKLRQLLIGATAADRKFFYKVLAQLQKTDPKAAERARARILTGGNAAVTAKISEAGARQFEKTFLAKPAKIIHDIFEQHGPKEVAATWRQYTTGVMNISTRLENRSQAAMAGNILRKSDLVDGKRFNSFSDKAVKQAAEGLRNTPEQRMVAQMVDVAYGKYSKFNPFERKLKQNMFPFLAWYANSVRFLLKTLPWDHPFVTSVLNTIAQATREERQAMGLAITADGFFKELQDAQMGGIKLRKGDTGTFGVGQATPFVIAADPVGTGIKNLLPQFSGAINNLQGQDVFGNPVRGDNSPLAKGIRAVWTLGNTFVPGLGITVRTLKRDKPLGKSIVRSINPLPITQDYYKKDNSPKSGSSGKNVWQGYGGGSSGGGSSSSQDIWKGYGG